MFPNDAARAAAKPDAAIDRLLVTVIKTRFPLRGQGHLVSASALPPLQWPQLVQSATHHGLALLFFAALSDTDAPPEATAALESLREMYRRNRLASRLAHDALGELLDAFTAQGIPLLVLKGAALSTLLYPEPGLRAFGDLDLLIRRCDLAAAQALMTRQGFAILRERHDGFSEQFLHALKFSSPQRSGLGVDLHWHLFSPLYHRNHTSISQFWQNPVSLAISQRAAKTLAPQMQLLYLCAHAALNHAQQRLIWLYDLTLLLQTYQQELNWEEIVRMTQVMELALPVGQVLTRAVEWWDAPVPSAPLTALVQTRQRPAARIVYFLVTLPQNELRVFANAFYQPGLLRKLAYALHLVFPAPAYMQHFHRGESTARLPCWYLQRWIRLARRLARSLQSLWARVGSDN